MTSLLRCPGPKRLPAINPAADPQRDLVDRLLADDASARRELRENFEASIYATSFQLLDDHRDAVALIREALDLVSSEIGNAQSEMPLSTHLYRIVIRLARKRRRLRWFDYWCWQATRPLHSPGMQIGTPSMRPALAGDRPQDALVIADFHRRVHQEMKRLSPPHREVLVLAGVDGISLVDLSAILAVPTEVAQTRLHGARERLREAVFARGEEAWFHPPASASFLRTCCRRWFARRTPPPASGGD